MFSSSQIAELEASHVLIKDQHETREMAMRATAQFRMLELEETVQAHRQALLVQQREVTVISLELGEERRRAAEVAAMAAAESESLRAALEERVAEALALRQAGLQDLIRQQEVR